MEPFEIEGCDEPSDLGRLDSAQYRWDAGKGDPSNREWVSLRGAHTLNPDLSNVKGSESKTLRVSQKESASRKGITPSNRSGFCTVSRELMPLIHH